MVFTARQCSVRMADSSSEITALQEMTTLKGIDMGREVHLVRIELTGQEPGRPAGSRHVNLGPVIYDLTGDPARGPRRPSDNDSVPDDFAQFLRTVLTDMNGLIGEVVSKYAGEWAFKVQNPTAETSFSADRDRPQIHDLCVRLLVDFAEHHPDFLRNLLIALLAERIEINASDPTIVTGSIGQGDKSGGAQT